MKNLTNNKYLLFSISEFAALTHIHDHFQKSNEKSYELLFQKSNLVVKVRKGLYTSVYQHSTFNNQNHSKIEI